MVSLATKIHNISLKNPVMTASGTFGYGEEFADFIDLSQLGGIIVKGTTGERRQGNAYPRMAETPSGMLNAVGLQNVGVGTFCKEVYPRIAHLDTNILVNVSGSSNVMSIFLSGSICELLTFVSRNTSGIGGMGRSGFSFSSFLCSFFQSFT